MKRCKNHQTEGDPACRIQSLFAQGLRKMNWPDKSAVIALVNAVASMVGDELLGTIWAFRWRIPPRGVALVFLSEERSQMVIVWKHFKALVNVSDMSIPTALEKARKGIEEWVKKGKVPVAVIKR